MNVNHVPPSPLGLSGVYLSVDVLAAAAASWTNLTQQGFVLPSLSLPPACSFPLSWTSHE